MFYWLTGTAGSAANLYYENMHASCPMPWWRESHRSLRTARPPDSGRGPGNLAECLTPNVVGSRYKRVEHRVRGRRSAQAPLSVRRARSAWICICVSLLITSKISPSVPMTNVVRLTGLMNERRPGETPYARATELSLSDSSG